MSGKERRKSTHKQLEKASNVVARLVPYETVAGSSTRSRGKVKVPAYRARPEYGQAVVTLTDKVSGARRDYWLGEIGSPESRERYYRTLAAWESRGRTLPTFEECGLAPTFHAIKRRRAEANANGRGGTRGSIAAALLIYWREVTDAGAGAGAISRAADGQLVLSHNEGGWMLKGAFRGFPDFDDRRLERGDLAWRVEGVIEPKAKGKGPGTRKRKPAPVSKEEFATRFVTAQPDTADAIINRALEAGVSKREARSLLDAAVADRLVDKVTKGGRIKDTFSRPRETEPC